MKIRTRRDNANIHLFPGDRLHIWDGDKLLHTHDVTEVERVDTILTVDVDNEAGLESGIGVIFGEKK